ncbi:MAG: NAD-dependent epimerase/dehydratase family protein, partial [Thermoleophilaceae bacterium]
PTGEDAPLRPTSVYGITKRDQEELILVLGRAYGLETVALRYLNVYGPRQALGNPYTGVAAIFAAKVRSGRPPLVFEDGGQLRDLVHVSDVVRATGLAMDAPAAAGQAINVATGRRVAILELAGRIAAALDSTLEPRVTGEHRAGDIRHCVVEVRRARQALGFVPDVTLEEGLPGLAEWVAARAVGERGDQAVAELRARGLVS